MRTVGSCPSCPRSSSSVSSIFARPCRLKYPVSTGMMTSSAATSALNVSSPTPGGQSTTHQSYLPLTVWSARRSRDSRPLRPLVSGSNAASRRSLGARSKSVAMFQVSDARSAGLCLPAGASSRAWKIVALTSSSGTASPVAQWPCGSMSASRVRFRSRARQAARLMAVVVLPQPPFWLMIATVFKAGSGESGGLTGPIGPTRHRPLPDPRPRAVPTPRRGVAS